MKLEGLVFLFPKENIYIVWVFGVDMVRNKDFTLYVGDFDELPFVIKEESCGMLAFFLFYGKCLSR